MSEHDPYTPPSVDVFDVDGDRPRDERLAASPAALPAGAGWRWYVRSWQLFARQPVMWWVAVLIVFGMFFLVSLIPLVNIAAYVLFPVLLAGFASCARSVDRGGSFELAQIFDGFRHQLGPLMIVGLIYVGATVGMMLMLTMAVGGVGVVGAVFGLEPDAGAPVAVGAMVIGVTVATAITTLASLVTIFAALIVFEFSAPLGAALQHAIAGSLRNVVPLIVSVVVYIGLAFAATLPAGLGWLVLIPMLPVVPWVCYREIFVETASPV